MSNIKSRARKFADLIGVNRIVDDTATSLATTTGVTVEETLAQKMSVANTQVLSNARLGATASVALTGDVTGTGSFSSNSISITTDISNSGVTAGTYGSSSQVPSFSVAADGRITSASQVAVAGVSSVSYTSANNNLRVATSDGTTHDVTISTTDKMSVANTIALANARLGATAGVTLSGDVTGSASFSSNSINITTTVADDSHNHIIGNVDGLQAALDNRMTVANTQALANARLGATAGITLTGAVTGTGSFSGNSVSITTTATSDPTITLAGDLTGSVTLTNLGNGTLTASVVDDSHNHIISNVDGLQTALNTKATWAALIATNTAIRSTISSEVASLIDSAPTTLNTLNELAAALGDNPNFATTLTTNLGQKLGGTATITLNGDVTGSGSFSANAVTITTTVADDSHNHIISNVDGLQSALNTKMSVANTIALANARLGAAASVTLTGAVTGTGTFSGNSVSIATTATSDPTLTLAGDCSGSATFTNLGNATLTVTVADDSHNHIISNVDGLQTALDAKLASSSYTAADVLTKIKTVDGAGSGLDADTLDGQQGTYYQPASSALTTSTSFGGDVSGTYNAIVVADDSHNHIISNVDGLQTALDGKLALSGGTMTGSISLGDNNVTDIGKINFENHEGSDYGVTGDVMFDENFYGDAEYGTTWSGGNGGGLAVYNEDGWGRILTDRNIQWHTATFDGLKVGSNIVWHAGNDGSGSGLDADLLDGQQGTYYQPASTALTTSTTFGGDVSGTYNAIVVADDSHNHTSVSSNFSITGGQLIGGFGAATTSGTTDWNHSTNARSGNGYTLLLGNATNGPGTSNYFHSFNFEYNSKNGNGNMTQFAIPYTGSSGPYFRSRYSNSWESWKQLWHSGNDGSGSGLDADTVDGIQGASFLRSDAADVCVSGATIQDNTGNYGSFEIDGGATGGWEGYSIGGRAVFMHDNSTGTGIYNDVNNEWLFYAIHNGESRMYYNGVATFYAYNNYTQSVGSSRAPIFYDSDDTNYYVNPAGNSVLSSIELGDSSGPILSQERNQNLKLQGSTGTDVGITGYDSAGNWRFQLYGSSSKYGFLNANWSSWDLRKEVNGVLYLNNQTTYYYDDDVAYLSRVYGITDIRSPIFYDNNDTAYYCDPASTSILNSATIYGSTATLNIHDTKVGGQNDGTNDYGDYYSQILFKSDDGTGYLGASLVGAAIKARHLRAGTGHLAPDHALEFWTSGSDSGYIAEPAFQMESRDFYVMNGNYKIGTADGGTTVINSSNYHYGAIFYDNNDTAYYTDPASTSIMATVRATSITAGTTASMTSAGQLAIGGATNPYISFHDASSATRDGYFQKINATDRFYFGEIGYTETEGSFRAPLFYDSDNTAYYVNPASDTSLVINGMILYGSTNAESQGGFVGRHGGLSTDLYPSPIYCIGTSYRPSGTGLSNMYGIGYAHTNASFYGLSGQSGWGMYVAADGDARVQLNGSNGTVSCTGAVVAYASDNRLKKNVTTITNSLEKLSKIRGVTYDWVDDIATEYDFYPLKMHEVGVIAQEIQEVLPEIVTEAPFNSLYTAKTGWKKIQKQMEEKLGRDVTKAEAKTEFEKLTEEERNNLSEDHKFLTVDYERITPLLIEAIKELNAKVEELEQKLNSQK